MRDPIDNPWLTPEPFGWWPIADDALVEDIGSGDITSGFLPADVYVDFMIEVQADGVLSGVGVAKYLLEPETEEESLSVYFADGTDVRPEDIILEGRLSARRLLQIERTALNFLMLMSGTATLTAQLVDAIQGTPARICDTRKTVPGMRTLQKYAVRCGGGTNHRMGLYDAVMIKDNHIRAFGSIGQAVNTIRAGISHLTKIEVEVEDEAQVLEAVTAGADVIMLDNMEPREMSSVIKKYGSRALFEASGGVTLNNIRDIAETGVDVISVGAITHSCKSLPIHLEVNQV